MSIPLTKSGKPDKRYKNNTQLNNTPNRIDVMKAFKLRVENELTYQQIADLFKVSPAAVHERLKPILKFIDNPDIHNLYRANKATIAESVQYQYLEALLDTERMKKASANNMGYVVQVLDNMIRLEQNKPTSNVAVHAIIQQRKQEREVNEIKGSGG